MSAKGADTRAHILDAAVEVFAAAGFHAASVREIAARCGLTHPALIYHFPTKADLLMAVLERRDARDEPGEGFAGLRGRDVLDHLVLTARRNARRPGLVELYATLSGEATSASHPAHGYFARRYASLLATVARAFEEMSRDGLLDTGVDPAVAARQTVALMDGLQIQWLLDRSVDMAAVLEAHLARLSCGARGPLFQR